MVRLESLGLPGTPRLLQAVGINQGVSVRFVPPVNDGGGPITGYQLACDNGAMPSTGAASPIVATGLTNGVNYQCSLSAINANGTSADTAFSIRPGPSTTNLVRVVSRKQHGMAGSFEIGVDHLVSLEGAVSIEPRGIDGTHALVFEFDGPVANVGAPMLTYANGAIAGTGTATQSGNSVQVQLSGLVDGRKLKVRLPGVNSNGADVSAALAPLVGDVNSTSAVNDTDVAYAKAKSGQAAVEATVQSDLNGSGVVTAADIAAIKARRGRRVN